MFCTNCGKQIPDDSKFCEYCGKPVLPVYEEKTENNPDMTHPAVSSSAVSKKEKKTKSSLFTAPSVQDQSRVKVINVVLLVSIVFCILFTAVKIIKHFMNHTAGNSISVSEIDTSETTEPSGLSAVFCSESKVIPSLMPSSTPVSISASDGDDILSNSGTADIFYHSL